MSQIESYDYSQFPPDDEDFDEMQMRGGSSWQGGWRPPSQQRPPYGPPWPPGPGSGGWPFWGYWGFRLRSAWRDVKFLNKLIGDIVNEQIDNGIISPGPNFVPGPGSTVPSQTAGIKGVTDGSDAGPGMVGEFVQAKTEVAYAAYPTVTTSTISATVLSPGDWQCWIVMQPSTFIGSGRFYLSPVPTGVSNNMIGSAVSTSATASGIEYPVIVGQTGRASISVPTLMPFFVQIDNSTTSSLPAGTADVTFQARRMR